jgi:hypothetical protein
VKVKDKSESKPKRPKIVKSEKSEAKKKLAKRGG